MRTTIDIPDGLYRQLKLKAAKQGTTIKALLLEAALDNFTIQTGNRAKEPGLSLPVIHSKDPGSLKLGEEGVYEYIPFP